MTEICSDRSDHQHVQHANASSISRNSTFHADASNSRTPISHLRSKVGAGSWTGYCAAQTGNQRVKRAGNTRCRAGANNASTPPGTVG
ncbi:hypothetical protein ACLKA6_019045 [Drosophila palustris]